MYNREIIRLQNQISKTKEIYEKRKKERELLVETMNNLDQKLEELEKIKGIKTENYQSKKENQKKKQKNQRIKNYLKQIWIKEIIIAVILLLIGNILFLKFNQILLQLSIVAGVNTLKNIIKYNKIKEKIPKTKKTTKKNFEKIEKEYQKIKEQRITIGQQYKHIREREVSAYNVYKTIEKLVTDKINTLNSQPTNQPINNTNNIQLNDIYNKISSYWSDYFEDNETAKKILDNQLKKYLIEKINEITNNPLQLEDLENLTTEELVIVIASYIPKCYHHQTLSHIIHAVLGYASNMQSYSIVWYEENDQILIESPSVSFDEMNRWNELKTHKNTDYITIFNKVYNTFHNDFMIKKTQKTKTKH